MASSSTGGPLKRTRLSNTTQLSSDLGKHVLVSICGRRQGSNAPMRVGDGDVVDQLIARAFVVLSNQSSFAPIAALVQEEATPVQRLAAVCSWAGTPMNEEQARAFIRLALREASDLRVPAQLLGGSDEVPGEDNLAGAVTAVAVSLAVSVAFMMADEWDDVRITHTNDLLVLIAARENPWLAWLVAEDIHVTKQVLAGEVELPEEYAKVSTAAVEKGGDLSKRVAALYETLPKATYASMKAPTGIFLDRSQPASRGPKIEAIITVTPDGFPFNWGGRGGVTLREIVAADAALPVPLPTIWKALYLATNGSSLPHVGVSPLHLLYTECCAISEHTQYLYDSKLLPVRNAVAGGRWGECWDMALATHADADLVVQVEMFFPPEDLTQMHAYSLEQSLAALERSTAAGKFNDCGHNWWGIKLDFKDSDIRKLADAQVADPGIFLPSDME